MPPAHPWRPLPPRRTACSSASSRCRKGSSIRSINNYLTAQGLSGDPGVAVGEQAALGILNMRMGDGRFPSNPEPFFGGSWPGPMASDLLLRIAPKPGADGHAVGGTGPALHFERLGTVPRRSAATAPAQRCLREGLRRSESARSVSSIVVAPRRKPTSPFFTTTTPSRTGIGLSRPSRTLISVTLAIVPGSSPWSTWRCPTLSLPPGTARRTGISGAP